MIKQVTRETIHNGFSGLSKDQKWRDSLNFRFFRNRTRVVMPKLKTYESSSSYNNYHTFLPGPDNSIYVLGRYQSVWLLANGDVKPLYGLGVKALPLDTTMIHTRHLEIRGSYDPLMDVNGNGNLSISVISVDPLTVEINGRVYSASRNTFIPISMGYEAVFPQDLTVGDSWIMQVFPLTAPIGVRHVAVQHTLGRCDHYFTSPQTSLTRLSGNTAIEVYNSRLIHTPQNFAAEVSYPNLKARDIEQAFGHLIIPDGNTIRWSDLNSPWLWSPDTSNEADYRILDWECGEITAVVRVNDQIFIHFPTAKYLMSYIGKPAIFNISQQTHGTGAISPTVVIAHKNSQFFIGLDNFYQTHPVDGDIPIGEPVWKRFTEECVEPTATWTYVDQANREICWVYKTEEGFNRILAFNYVERHWARYSANDILDHISILSYKFQLNEEVDPPVYERTDTVVGYESRWLTANSVLRDVRPGDDIGDILPFEQPFLETDHFTYGDIFNTKDVDLISFDSQYSLPWSGWDIKVSAKQRVTEDSEYEDFGLWRMGMHHSDSTTKAGHTLQFKFLLNSEILEDGFIVGEGKTWDDTLFVFLWDGSYNADLANGLPLRIEEYVGWTGLGLNKVNPDFACVLYAWGERVNLPDTDVGPDKQ